MATLVEARTDTGAQRGKICMVVYAAEPSILPPLLNKARSLVQSGYEVETICHTGDPRLPRRETDRGGFEVVRVRSWTRRLCERAYGLSPRSSLLALVQYLLTYTEYNLRVALAALRSRADLYEAHELPTLPVTLWVALVLRRPVVYHAHEIHAETHRQVRFATFWRLLERALVPFVDLVITPEENRSRIMEREAGARRPPLTVMNCPPFQEPLGTNRLREELARRGVGARFILLYQGLFDEERCLAELVESSRYFADGVVLVLMGGSFGKGPDPAAQAAGAERVVVLPRVPYDEVLSYTASADAGILLYRNTCRNNYYCAPNKLHEYMMMGLPVIANDYPGIRKLVEGERVGLTVAGDDPRQIAAAVNRLAGEPELRREFSENALRLSRDRYNWEHEYARLEAEYRRLLHAPA